MKASENRRCSLRRQDKRSVHVDTMSDSFLTAASSRAADGLDLTGLSLSSSSAADAALIPFYTYCRVRSEYFEGSGNGMKRALRTLRAARFFSQCH